MQMGKVQNRLPLFLGIVYFPRKMPLMAVMDTARRMFDQVPMDEETWQVASNSIMCGKVKRSLSSGNKHVNMTIPIKMGDGTTDDIWYPYFFVEKFADGTPDSRPYRFQHNGHWLIHVNDLKEGDTIRVTPSRLSYLFLGSTADRFPFNPKRDVLLLDDLSRLEEMWQQICASPDMSDTKLRAIHTLFETKRVEWNLGEPTVESPITDETFRRLVETTLKVNHLPKEIVEDVLSGLFRRCIDLHLHILKHRVSDMKRQEGSHDREQ